MSDSAINTHPHLEPHVPEQQANRDEVFVVLQSLDRAVPHWQHRLPLPGVEAAIVKQETGEPVPTGEEGELVVRGPNIMQGYWNRAEETCQVFHNSWLRTGDLGKMDADGYFSIVERVKDVIIASGLKVYPRGVEEVLFKHPAVAEVAVAGVADAYRGETVAAFVVLKAGMEASEEIRRGLLQYCKQELAAYKVPTILEFRYRLHDATLTLSQKKALFYALSLSSTISLRNLWGKRSVTIVSYMVHRNFSSVSH